MVVDNSDIGHGEFERIACIIFISITPLFLFARFFGRYLSKQWGSDDWAALAAFVFVMACNCVTLAAFRHGWGRHKKNLSPHDLQSALILHWVFQITYKMSVALNKASILLLYTRIMPQRFYRIAIFSLLGLVSLFAIATTIAGIFQCILLGLVSLFAIATTIAGIFQCIPVQKAWNKEIGGHCYNLVDAWYSNAVFSIITDILILILPMYMVYKLQKDTREKILLYAVFGLGIFVTITSIMRFFYLKSAKNPDTTYDINSGYWSVIEINVGIICVCMPPLHSLLSRQFKIFNAGRSHATGGSEGPYQHANSNANSELVTIGGTGKGGRKDVRKRQDPKDSEEELVYFAGDHSITKEGGILKKTEFAVTERATTGSEVADQTRMKPWENHLHSLQYSNKPNN